MSHDPPNCQSLAAGLGRRGIEARSAAADAEGRVTVDCYRGVVDRRVAQNSLRKERVYFLMDDVINASWYYSDARGAAVSR